ncbi:VIT family protein [Synechococcus sp. MIT S9509]|uniref:VIT1/CCC1 transporter family protein n=1 Tax=unclassified Synechococcus TaxID=2626047 RepID=UPI0007BB0BB8|nr:MULTISPECIES: VIT1/CCC1 transporter family protein [unclassified Synechococcus]KZR87666.1 VIT family protein [Synechococcus sp. MIT S9504]KZR93174.1 VIT family protein [Synechococcus sp. MIT S9509]
MALSLNLKSIRRSFYESIGEIVFGMEDGAVTIFGLVAGVAISANSSTQVLLAGASGGISSAISMMCGVFLDLQSDHDQERIKDKKRVTRIQD